MSQTEYTTRRRRLMQMMGKDSIAIIPAAPVTIRNRDIEHRYRPDSDFYYLTGFAEPEAVAVIIPKRKHGEYILFCRERDPEMEAWVGPRAGLEGARDTYQADDAFPISDIAEILPGLLENRDRVFYTMGCNPAFDQQIISWVNQIRQKARSGVNTPNEFVALDHLLHDMRLFKSRHEISIMRKAAKIAATAHIRAMQKCRPEMTENQIEAEILHHFRQNNCTEAYPSIVGGGANSCILHYIDNQEPLNDGDLLLIDAGAEKDYYASDITRT
ncbi:aminopeptidase P N-terminal domain-containing protein, partial [Kaarinaea lacus]